MYNQRIRQIIIVLITAVAVIVGVIILLCFGVEPNSRKIRNFCIFFGPGIYAALWNSSFLKPKK